MMPSLTTDVTGLGKISTDITYYDDSIVQYRGIPYGSINQRFTQSTLVDKWPNELLDASQYGPVSPSPPMGAISTLFGPTLPGDGVDPIVDEFSCLNLNITAPLRTRELGTRLPVAVFIHGGANCMGAGSSPQYNGAHLVHLSMQINSPIVYITLNYRLGAFGFLASEELREDNNKLGDSGVGNYGIRDQIVALEWIKRYIHSFGGDSDNVTVFGESAGGSDIHIQMLSRWSREKKLFRQAAIMSGNAVLTTRSLIHQSGIFQKFLSYFQIPETLSGSEKVQRLREVSMKELLEAYICTGTPLPNWQATVDDFFLDEIPRYSALPNQVYGSHVQRVIVGDCQREGAIYGMRIAKGEWTSEKLKQLFQQYFNPEQVARLIKDYSLEIFDTAESVTKLEPLLTDAEFGEGIYEIARSWKGSDAFYYHMRFPNPFPGPFFGIAHHAVDLLFIFQTYNNILPEPYRLAAEAMGRHWINFICGKDPWPSYASSESAMCYGPQDISVLHARKDEMGAYDKWDFIRTLQDKISNVSMNIRGEMIFQ